MPKPHVDIAQLFSWSLEIFHQRRREADEVHRVDCAQDIKGGILCDCGEPARQRLMLDAMRNTAAALNTTVSASHPTTARHCDAEDALRTLLWAFNNEPTHPERMVASGSRG